MIRFNKSILIALVVSFFTSFASAQNLPIESVRTQEDTSHCWAYAMSHMLESRALVRENLNFIFDIEKDVKYWVDYERMLFIYKTKGYFYLGDYEGGWQIEFWQSLLNHGKLIYKSEPISEKDKFIKYDYPQSLKYQYPFLEHKRSPTQEIQDDFQDAENKLLDPNLFKTEEEAITYIKLFLDSYYGKPALTTEFLSQELGISQVAQQVLGSDYPNISNLNPGMILVKPVTDNEEKWVKYIENRFWGYRMNETKIYDLIKLSLNKGWPVTYDNVYHAMTLIGYKEIDGKLYFANADSQTRTENGVTWIAADQIHLNLLTFYHDTIKEVVGEIKPEIVQQLLKSKKNYDQIDNIPKTPPGSFKLKNTAHLDSKL